MVSEYLFNNISFDKLQKRLFECIKRTRKRNFQWRFSIHKLYTAVEKFTDIINASPYFRNTSVDFEKSINSFHSSTHRILCCENGVARSISKLSEECEVDTSVRNDIRAVTFCTRHKESSNVRHHCRYTDCTIFCKIHNLVFWYSEMIQPFSSDFFTCTIFHRFLNIVSRHICK